MNNLRIFTCFVIIALISNSIFADQQSERFSKEKEEELEQIALKRSKYKQMRAIVFLGTCLNDNDEKKFTFYLKDMIKERSAEGADKLTYFLAEKLKNNPKFYSILVANEVERKTGIIAQGLPNSEAIIDLDVKLDEHERESCSFPWCLSEQCKKARQVKEFYKKFRQYCYRDKATTKQQ